MSIDALFWGTRVGFKREMGVPILVYLKNRQRSVRRFLFVAAAVFLLSGFMLPAVTYAQGALPQGALTTEELGLDGISETTGLSGTDIRVTIARIIRIALGLLGIAAVVIVIAGGVLWMTAGGDPAKVEKAKKVLINGAIGMAIILSAFAITQFVLKALLGEGGGLLGGGGPRDREEAARFARYAGASHLGKVIQDHYPARDADDVARNTQIIVTFREPMDAATLVLDAAEDGGNGNGSIGDCVDGVCDKLNSANVLLVRSDEKEIEGSGIIAVDAVATNEGRTFTFMPQEYLGAPNEEVQYTVVLKNGIKRALGDDAFGGLNAQYEWQFTTGGQVDVEPPHIARVSPVGDGGPDRLVQITFSEAMSPVGLEVSTDPLTDHFVRVVVNEDGSEVRGRFRLVNGYRTAVFTPDFVCGQNACGDEKRCLPFNKEITLLLEAAELLREGNSAGIPGSGLTDTAGNSFDGGGAGEDGRRYDGRAGGPPLRGEVGYPLLPDNYWWNITTTGDIDLTSPTIAAVMPAAIAENGGLQGSVNKDAGVDIVFSEEMSYGALTDNVRFETEPEAPPIGFSVRMEEELLVEGQALPTKTRVRIEPALDLVTNTFYAPHVPHTVSDARQNCYYPAIGPGCAELTADNPSCCSYRRVNQSPVPAPSSGCGENLSVGE